MADDALQLELGSPNKKNGVVAGEGRGIEFQITSPTSPSKSPTDTEKPDFVRPASPLPNMHDIPDMVSDDHSNAWHDASADNHGHGEGDDELKNAAMAFQEAQEKVEELLGVPSYAAVRDRARSRSPSPLRSGRTSPFEGYKYTDRDAERAREILEGMRGTLVTLGQTFEVLHQQSSRVAALGPTIDSATQIQQVRRQMRAQEKRQDERIKDVKKLVRDVLKEQIAEHMRAQIADQIKEELALQIRSQVTSQLADRGLSSAVLSEAALSSKVQLTAVRVSLLNGEARRANAPLRANNLEEPLARVVRADDATVGEFWPKDLKTLFGYDGHAVKRLVQEYDLPVSDSREKNLNRFMAHIGLAFSLVPVPAGHGMGMGDMTTTTTAGFSSLTA